MGQKVTAWLCDFLIPLAPAPSARVTNQGNSRQPEAPPRQPNREKGTARLVPFPLGGFSDSHDLNGF